MDCAYRILKPGTGCGDRVCNLVRVEEKEGVHGSTWRAGEQWFAPDLLPTALRIIPMILQVLPLFAANKMSIVNIDINQ